MKRRYEKPEMKILYLATEQLLTLSNPDVGYSDDPVDEEYEAL